MTLLHQEDQLFDLLKTRKSGAKVIAALALGKKIPDGYDNNE